MDRHHIDQGSLNVYAAILTFKLDHAGLSPSIPDLVELTGYQSTKPITDRLNDLEERGLIKRAPGTPRSIELVGGLWSVKLGKVSKVTPKQARVLRELVRYAKKHDGNPPTMSNLRQILGYKSDSTVGHHIHHLVNAGLVEPTDHNHRSLKVRDAVYTVELDKVPEPVRATASRVLAESMVPA